MKTSITFFLLFFALNCNAQFKNLDSLKAKIKSFSNDTSLTYFLFDNKLFFDERPRNTMKKENIYHFLSNVQVEFFYKNLFGDGRKEAIMQIRGAEKGEGAGLKTYLVNVFYFKNELWEKVPGQIYTPLSFESGDPSFTFGFENLFKQNEYCIMSKTASYGYTSYDEVINIYKISEDEIKQIFEKHIIENGTDRIGTRWDNKCTFSIAGAGYPKTIYLDCASHSTSTNYHTGKTMDANSKSKFELNMKELDD